MKVKCVCGEIIAMQYKGRVILLLLGTLLQSRKNGIGRGTRSIFTDPLLNNILIFNIFKFLVLVTFTMKYATSIFKISLAL